MNRRRRFPTVLLLAGFFGALPARADLTCPAGPVTFGEGAFRGFYVDHLDGTALDSVTLRYYAAGPPTGSYAVTLTAHLDTYDGPILGSNAQTFFPFIPPGSANTVTFDFGGVAVPAGSRVAFTQVVDVLPLGGSLDLDPGPCTVGDVSCGSCPLFTETEDTTPPLSTFRRRSVAATIATSGAPSAAPVPALGLSGTIALLIGLVAAGWWVTKARPS